MSLKIFIENDIVILYYSPNNGTEWIRDFFDKDEPITIKKTFNISQNELVQNDENIENESEMLFNIGFLDNEYFRIKKEILMTDYDVLFHKSCTISIDYFIINSNVSILLKFDKLAKQQIIISGDLMNSIPESVYKNIIKSLPTKIELNYYVDSRITNVISQYLDGVKDSGKAFEKYLENRDKNTKFSKIESVNSYEFEKYSFILFTLKNMLASSDSYKESDWQKKILEIILILYPKYIRCFSSVKINDYYSNNLKMTRRFIDLLLIDSNGSVDVIEIKKPFSNCVISSNTYRDNYTPLKELSGTIMQIEKYIFHLNKWGVDGEKTLTSKYQDKLPNQFKIQITNPKGIVIIGRDNNLTSSQLFDLEIIKRKYANVMDIITYDDLIKRVENVIEKFKYFSN